MKILAEVQNACSQELHKATVIILYALVTAHCCNFYFKCVACVVEKKCVVCVVKKIMLAVSRDIGDKGERID